MAVARSSTDPASPEGSARPADRPTPRTWRPTPLLAGTALVHVGALPLILAAPGLRLAAATLLVADHLLVTGAGLWPTSRWLGPNLARLPGGGRAVALTFDDGPDPEVTPRVLDLLDRHGARATFFCIGERVARHPGLAAEIARRGHRVENHSHRHLKRFSVLPPRATAREIDRAQEAIAAATGRVPELFRPPAGFRNALLEPLLARRGLSLVSWTRRAFDTVRRDPDPILRRLTRGLAPGEIVLLHDGWAAPTSEGRAVVLEVLPRLLRHLEAEDLQAVAIDVSPVRGEAAGK